MAGVPPFGPDPRHFPQSGDRDDTGEGEDHDDTAAGTPPRGLESMVAVQGVALLVAACGGLTAGTLVWLYAPAVGGAWAPYVRGLAALVAGGIGVWVTGLLAFGVAAYTVGAAVLDGDGGDQR